MDPLPTLASERRFIDAAKEEFWKGWQIGSDSTIQSSTICSNHLTAGILKYFQSSGRLREATKFFRDLYSEDKDLGAVLAKTLIDTDEEVEAVYLN
jgi:Chs5-Arf1p-binding protein BUD7/BCH1